MAMTDTREAAQRADDLERRNARTLDYLDELERRALLNPESALIVASVRASLCTPASPEQEPSCTICNDRYTPAWHEKYGPCAAVPPQEAEGCQAVEMVCGYPLPCPNHPASPIVEPRCFQWPRECSHFDDLACHEAEPASPEQDQP